MKKDFFKKSNSLAFFGLVNVIALSISSTILQSCNNEKPENVNKEPQIVQKKSETKLNLDNHRTIYLTFDDGPNKGTQNLLKIVNERKVPITAFVVGQHVFGSKKQKDDFELLKKNPFIEISNHSYTHAFNNKYTTFYENPLGVVEDFNRANDSLNFENRFIRTPGRNIWRLNTIVETDIKKSTEAADELAKNKFIVVGWDLEWKPTKDMKLKESHEVILKRIDSIFYNDLEKTSRNLVFLTHDQYLTDENSVNELNTLILKLQKTNRFQFKKLSEYPKINELLN